MRSEIIFSEENYTVKKNIVNAPLLQFVEYIVSDGVHSFGSEVRPPAELKVLKKRMAEYLTERRDSLDEEDYVVGRAEEE